VLFTNIAKRMVELGLLGAVTGHMKVISGLEYLNRGTSGNHALPGVVSVLRSY